MKPIKTMLSSALIASALAGPGASAQVLTVKAHASALPQRLPAVEHPVSVTSGTCDDQSAAKPVLALLQKYVDHVETLKKDGRYPANVDPVSDASLGWTITYRPMSGAHAFGLSAAPKLEPATLQGFTAVLSCSKIARGNKEQLESLGLFVPPHNSGIYYASPIGFYLISA